MRRLGSVCTGAFLLGPAGLRSGRSVGTHWAATKLLSDSFANVNVNPDRIFAMTAASGLRAA
jgi:transcriptional regulator GlxA family with amidase domain